MEDRKELKKKIIVTGGGSGGHVSTAYSIIKIIQNRYSNFQENLLYIGGDLGMQDEKPGNSIEKRIFKKESFNQKYIRAGKLQREISLKSMLRLLRVVLGFFDSINIIKEFKPDIVISTGGFVSVPVCIIAKLFKADVYLHEQTAVVGLSNKIVGKFAKKIFITFPSSEKYFSKEKVIHTGNLLRQEIFNKSGSGPIVESLKEMIEIQEEYPIIYISGGSLGSHCINIAVKDALQSLLQDYQIVLQTGDNKTFNDYDSIKKERKKLREDLQKRLLLVKYVQNYEIGYLLNNIDLFVGRSGANTVYEMGILRIPSILIPIPWVTHNEQAMNAQILQNAGLAEIMNEGELTPEQLVIKINSFLKKEKKINDQMLKNIFKKDADKKILEYLQL